MRKINSYDQDKPLNLDGEEDSKVIQEDKSLPPTKGFRLLGRIFSTAELGLGDVWCGVLISFMTLFMATEIIARLIFNYSFMGIVDIIGLCMIMITYACLAAVERDNSHIKMSLVPDRLKGRLSGSILEIVNILVGMAAISFLLYAVTMSTIRAAQIGSITMTIGIPYWPAAMFMPLGCVFFLIRMGLQLAKTISRMSSPS